MATSTLLKRTAFSSSRQTLFQILPIRTIITLLCVLCIAILINWQMLYNGYQRYTIPIPATDNMSTDFTIYITIPCGGRLGNQMFEYAGMRGIAHRHKMIPCINHQRFTSLLSAFNIHINQCKSGLSNSVRIAETNNVTLTLSIINNLPRKNISLVGHFSSYYYFKDIVEDIRHDYTFKSHIKKTALDILYNARPQKWNNTNFIQVGLHIRRTDMITKRRQKFGFVFPAMSYFEKAMNVFTANYSHVQFVIASDDQQWCHHHLNVTRPGVAVHFLSGISPAIDMAVLSSCDHMIMSIGTFGWWSSWLNQGQRVYNKNAAPKKTHHWRMTHEGRYPKSWIPIL